MKHSSGGDGGGDSPDEPKERSCTACRHLSIEEKLDGHMYRISQKRGPSKVEGLSDQLHWDRIGAYGKGPNKCLQREGRSRRYIEV